MSKIRVEFSRGEEVKYISHLDTLRTFERAVRRAGIPIAYSQGFNPRPIMSFGLPLAVGVTSSTEYVDVEVQEDIAPEELVIGLNNNLPKGFNIHFAEYINSSESLMASIGVASYEVVIEVGNEVNRRQMEDYLDAIMKEDSLVVEKEKKGKTKKIDILPYIYELKIIEFNESIMALGMTLAAGSVFNLKPEMVIAALSKVSELELSIRKVHRTGLFDKQGKKLI